MFRIVALDPYTAEPTGSYGKEYNSKSEAISIVEELIQEARNLPYGEPYLYAVARPGKHYPDFVGGYSGCIDNPIPEFLGIWRTICNRLIEEWGVEAEEIYNRYYAF